MISPDELPQWMNNVEVHPLWMPIRQRMLEMDQMMGFSPGTFENHDVFLPKLFTPEAFDRAGTIRRQHMIDMCTLFNVARAVHSTMTDAMFCNERFTYPEGDSERMGCVAQRMVPIFEL